MRTNEDEKAFARTFFAPDGEGDHTLRNLLATGGEGDQDADDKQKQRTDTGDDEFTDEQRQWARELFADEDAGVLAGLTDGRTVGRTTPPRAEDIDRGGWFDRTPVVDD